MIQFHPNPPAEGLSSDCTIVGDLVFTTQIPVDDNDVMPEGIGAQAALVLEQTRKTLESVGSTMADVAHLTIYLTDIGHRAVFNKSYAQAFQPPYPVRAAIGIDQLARPGMLVEVTAIAARR
ncbi:RidA family protein [Streptomyces sp. NPDC091280]|uniref:RidA family protein n=1 Tax=Streptomyces sp. NPDC091280 TaxID=3365984 RepID=UPI003805C756